MDRRTARALIASLNRDAEVIAARFGLRYRAIEAERAHVNSHYGVCYSDGTIRIRLRHASTGRPLKYSSLVSTLCHELAHLRHFNHGERFRGFYALLLEFARNRGIYRPGPVRRGRGRPQDRAATAPQAATAHPAAAHPAATAPRAAEGPRQLTLFG